MKRRKKLSAKLRCSIPDSFFKFHTTESVVPHERHIINQKRAVSAMDFALGINSKGYNFYVSGNVGTGRHVITRRIIETYARSRPKPSDWCFVHNFRDADRPLALSFPAGTGTKFAEAMENAVKRLEADISKIFDNKEHEIQKQTIASAIQDRKTRILGEIEEKAKDAGVQIQRTPSGVLTFPVLDGKPLTPTEFQALEPQLRESMEVKQEEFNRFLREQFRVLRELDKKLQTDWQELDRYAIRFVVEPIIEELRENFGKYSHVNDYLSDFERDIMSDYGNFLSEKDESKETPDFSGALGGDPFLKYRVNLAVDNSQSPGAPVIEEGNPTYYNLVGRIEKMFQMGTTYTDFTLIKAGALLKANGGILILNAEDILRQPFSWTALKRALVRQEICIEDVPEVRGYIPTSGIRPTSIPLQIKVALIGNPYLYYLLWNYDSDFRKIFKVRADFEYEMPFSRSGVNEYARYISRVVNDEKLLHFDASGVAAMVEYGTRLAESQKKLSLRLIDIADTLRESSHLARGEKSKYVSRTHIEKVLEEREYRSRLVADKIKELIKEGTLFVSTDGKAVGQINGLSVYDFGSFRFGRPSRITAATRMGEEGIIDIERRVKLSGSSYDKGVLIISGFLGERFAHNKPMALATSICFEQSYSEIDGDSASAAELYVIFSSLAKTPIYQGIAVTGSVNQKGYIQPIGGVNEKVEGFYEVCKMKKLTGRQGVIIPRVNMKNLTLKAEVCKSIEQGKFHIYPIDHIDDGVKILMGIPAGKLRKDGAYQPGTLNARIDNALKEMALKIRRFGDERKRKKQKAKRLRDKGRAKRL